MRAGASLTMTLRIGYFGIWILLFPLHSFPQQFDFNEKCKAAYREIFSLRLEKGESLIAEEKKLRPDNLIPLLLGNYIDLLNIVITEDESQLASFKADKSSRIDELKKGDAGSPWLLCAQAEVHLQYALASILFREYLTGLLEMRKASMLLEENERKFPGFKPGMEKYYVIQSLLGAIPEKYNWGLRIIGLSGNLEAGMTGLEKLSKDDWGDANFLRGEAVLTHALLLLHLEGKRNEAWEEVSEKFPEHGNLFSYYAALKIAVYSHHNDEALQMIDNIPSGNEYAQIPILNYYIGLALLQNLDTMAIAAFREFLSTNKEASMVKSAYHKIAWAYLINGKTEGYYRLMNLMRSNGIAQADADRQAMREGENPLPPHPELLKSRLLFDGGYFKRALQILENIPHDSLAQKQYQLELAYRQGRIFDETGDTVRAIERYMVTINQGKEEPCYFAASAALNLGLIYEAKGNYQLARQYFIESLKMDNHEYKYSLAQKAKAGLERLK